MNQKPSDEEFEGHASEMRPETPWLASEDIDGKGDVKVTIDSVHRHKNVKVQDGRSLPLCYSLKFKKATKQLMLNTTNRKKLIAYFGTNVKEWKDKEIKLYVDKNVQLMGETVSGIRIR